MGHYNPSIPISKRELEEHGLWDIDRYTRPYRLPSLLTVGVWRIWTEPFVDAGILSDLFGADAEHAISLFFDSHHDRFKFKLEFSSEVKILVQSDSQLNAKSKYWLNHYKHFFRNTSSHFQRIPQMPSDGRALFTSRSRLWLRIFFYCNQRLIRANFTLVWIWQRLCRTQDFQIGRKQLCGNFIWNTSTDLNRRTSGLPLEVLDCLSFATQQKCWFALKTWEWFQSVSNQCWTTLEFLAFVSNGCLLTQSKTLAFPTRTDTWPSVRLLHTTRRLYAVGGKKTEPKLNYSTTMCLEEYAHR